MTANFSTRLDELVTAGKITAEQKQLIINKQAELQKQRETNRDQSTGKTDAERKTAMETERAELEAWAKTNNIDLTVVGMEFGGRGGKGMRGEGKGQFPMGGGPGGEMPDNQKN